MSGRDSPPLVSASNVSPDEGMVANAPYDKGISILKIPLQRDQTWLWTKKELSRAF